MRFILPALELVDSEASQHTPVTLNPVALSIYFALFCLAGLASAAHILRIAGIRGHKNLLCQTFAHSERASRLRR